MTEKEFYKMLGEKVKDLRKKSKMTQIQLAEKAGITQAELSKFESNGEKIRSADRINAILSCLGHKLDVSEKKTLLTCA
jgi:transcriptional regulator with XRE-family HTH domain